MALLHNISLCSTSKPLHLSTSKPYLSISSFPFRFPSQSLSLKQNHHQHSKKLTFSLTESVSSTALIALLSASLFFVDPALAFKGGGPYGQEVTRGQDLTGKDFSGKTLIKQDFKTSILRQANFKGAKLLGASFFDADLTGADLSEADLRSADFSLANVTKEIHLSRAQISQVLILRMCLSERINANISAKLQMG
ncbi:hypothetical protein TanjilG_23846 [Lupinus angustifolius]|uniref:Uncharacterized protein n=1 Tax=Lupinus angustifolius TaxID=3871 RepID=A0A4P1QVE5_LUPAN|nr:hypothetical protein TanjilG_23846 [Lupinus angustifolius]